MPVTPSLSIGGKEYVSPPKKKTGGTAYRGATGSTTDSIAQKPAKCKENVDCSPSVEKL